MCVLNTPLPVGHLPYFRGEVPSGCSSNRISFRKYSGGAAKVRELRVVVRDMSKGVEKNCSACRNFYKHCRFFCKHCGFSGIGVTSGIAPRRCWSASQTPTQKAVRGGVSAKEVPEIRCAHACIRVPRSALPIRV